MQHFKELYLGNYTWEAMAGLPDPKAFHNRLPAEGYLWYSSRCVCVSRSRAFKFQGLAPHAADLAEPTPKPYKTDQNKGPGTFPTSRLDSHRNFEPI